MSKEKRFTNKILNQITGFLLCVIVLWSIVQAKGVWDKQVLIKEKELISVAVVVQYQVQEYLEDIIKTGHNQDLTINDKVLIMNEVLQNPMNEISTSYPSCGIGYYDKSVNSIIAIAPNFDYPFFKSYESGTPEWLSSETSIGWMGEGIIGVTVPVFLGDQVIGHTWANMKTDEIIIQTLIEAGKLLITAIFIGLLIVLFLRRRLRQTLNILSQFSQQIIEGKYDKNLAYIIPELSPVLEKLEQYTHNLKSLNQEYNRTNKMLDTILEGISDGLFYLDKEWRLTYLNTKAKSMSLQENQELVGKHFWDVFSHAVGSEVYYKLQEAMIAKRSMHWETHAVVTDKYYLYSAYPAEHGLTVFIQDITEMKHMHNKLVRLASIVESTDDAIIGKTLEGIITTWNTGAERIFGFKEAEMIGKHVSVLVPDDQVYDYEILETIGKGEKVQHHETTRKTKDGKEVKISITVSPILNKQGNVIGASTIAKDITYRKEIEDLLEKEIRDRITREAHFSAVFNNSLLGIITLDKRGTILLSNPTFEKILGYSQEELLNRNFSEFTYPEDIEISDRYLCSLVQGGHDHYEIEKRYVKKDGKTVWVHITVAISREHEAEFIIAFVQDVTEKKMMQEQMVRFDRLNLVGEMAAGISHEVRNPMTTVRGFLQMLKHKDECQNYEDYFDLMIEELDRANNIISEFLSIGKNSPSDLERMNLNSIVTALVPLIEANAYGKDQYLEVETTDIPDLLLNSKEIRQVILNLCQNGIDAMTAGGVLTIKTYLEDNKVILAVQDQGEGITPEVLEKLGTPFFTTKKKGTGLGLGICFSIAARHNAQIEIDTSTTGTTFYLKFDQIIAAE